MKRQTQFKIQINTDETITCGTYLKDTGLSLGILTPDGDSFEWQRFLRKLKDGDLLVIRQIPKVKVLSKLKEISK